VNINEENLFKFAETKSLTFYIDDESIYFPTDRLDTIYYDDLNDIDTTSLSMNDIVVISDLNDNYVFRESDISGINTIFDQGAMIIFIGFEKSYFEEYENEFNAIGIEATHNHRIGDIAIFYLCNDKMIENGASYSSEYDIRDHRETIWDGIANSVRDMYEELEYLK